MNNNDNLCTSVFKSDNNLELRKNFMIKWVEIINNLEKEKIVNFSKQ